MSKRLRMRVMRERRGRGSGMVRVKRFMTKAAVEEQ